MAANVATVAKPPDRPVKSSGAVPLTGPKYHNKRKIISKARCVLVQKPSDIANVGTNRHPTNTATSIPS